MAALAVACLALPWGCTPSGSSKEAQTWVVIRDQRVAVEIAATREEQTRGLGGRPSLDWDRGMLFVYDQPGFYPFWMKGMHFDIDILWILDDRITDIASRVRHFDDGPGPTYRPSQLANRVLEVPAGYSQARGWRVGDRVRVDSEKQGAVGCAAARGR